MIKGTRVQVPLTVATPPIVPPIIRPVFKWEMNRCAFRGDGGPKNVSPTSSGKVVARGSFSGKGKGFGKAA